MTAHSVIAHSGMRATSNFTDSHRKIALHSAHSHSSSQKSISVVVCCCCRDHQVHGQLLRKGLGPEGDQTLLLCTFAAKSGHSSSNMKLLRRAQNFGILQQQSYVLNFESRDKVPNSAHLFFPACSSKNLSKPPLGAVPCMSLPPLCWSKGHTTSM